MPTTSTQFTQSQIAQALTQFPEIETQILDAQKQPLIPMALPDAIYLYGDGNIKGHLTLQLDKARYFVNYTPERIDVPFDFAQTFYEYDGKRYLAYASYQGQNFLDKVPRELASKIQEFLKT